MQRELTFAVTVGRSENSGLESQAKSWANQFGVKYLQRSSKGSLEFLCQQEQVEALLVATKTGPQIYTSAGTFFFHPSMAVLRLQRLKNNENDHFAAALELKQGMKVLDCTMGLASDAAVASFLVGTNGKVCAVEASPLVHFVVSKGLQDYQAEDADLNDAMRRIETVCSDAAAYLQTLPVDCFDAIYFDPMFKRPVGGSSNMEPLRPVAFEQPLAIETVEAALRVAPLVVIKERGQKLLEALGCTEIQGGRYSRIKYGIRRR